MKISAQIFVAFLLSAGNLLNGQEPDWTRVLQLNTFSNQNGLQITSDANYAYMAGNISGPVTFDGINYSSTGVNDMILVRVNTSGTTSWKKVINAGTSGIITPNAIKVDISQNVFVSGTFTGSMTIGSNTVTSTTLINSFMAKFDNNGTGLWVSSFESTATGISRIALDAGGNSYLVSGTNKLIKFSSSGSQLWQQNFPNKTLRAVAVSGSELFVAGALQPGSTSFGTINLTSTNLSNNGYLARADLNGIYNKTIVLETPVLSTKQGSYAATGTFVHPTAGTRPINMGKNLIGSSENVLKTTVGDLLTSQGNLILTINPDNSVSIGGTITSGPASVIATVGQENRYDPATKKFYLNYEYTLTDGKRTISEVLTYSSPLTSISSVVSDIAINTEGKLIITGSHTDNTIFNPLTVIKTSSSLYTYIAKCDNNFAFEWVNSSNSIANSSEYFNYRIFLDNSNNIYEYGIASMGFSFGSLNNINSNGAQFIIRFDPGGNPIFSNSFTRTAVDRICVSPTGKVYSTGSYNYTGASPYGNLYLIQYGDIYNLNLDWEKTSSGQSGTANIYYVKHDNSGNTYIQARVLGYCNFFGTVIKKDTEVTVFAKLDINNNLLWLSILPDLTDSYTGPKLEVDQNKNLITTGRFGSSLDIGTETLANQNLVDDLYLIKYSSGGMRNWAVQFHTDGESEINGITTDKENNIIVSGKFTSQLTVLGNSINSGTDEGLFVLKLDQNGNYLWIKGFVTGGIVYSAMPGCDDANNIYIAADIAVPTGDLMTFGTVSAPHPGDEATVLVKFDLYGNAKWVKTYGAVPGNDDSSSFPTDIKTDGAGNTYLYGWCMSNAVFGTTTLVNPISNSQPFFYYLTKINTTGDVLWAKAVYEKKQSFNYGDMLDLDEAGNVYIGGHFKDEIKIESTSYFPTGLNDFFIAKYLNNGTFGWIKSIPSNGNIINGICVFKDNVLSICGYAGINSTLGSFQIDKKGGSSTIVATLGNLEVTTASPYMTEISDESISLYPNPNKGKFNISLDEYVGDKTKLTIYNSSGVLIKDINVNSSAGILNQEIDLGPAGKGLYFLRIQNSKSVLVRTFVVK